MTSDNGVRDGLVAVVHRSGSLPDRLASGVRAVSNGVWLGVLRDEEFVRLDERYYAATDLYHTETWNERGLFEWERELVEQQLADRHRIAVLACGGGREVLALHALGHDVVGYESHAELRAFANRFLADRGMTDAVRGAPRDSFPLDDGTFDGVILGWGAYSLVHGRARRVSLLRSVAASLRADGRMMVSAFERPDDRRELRWTAAIANGLRRARNQPPVELGDTMAPNRVHEFTREELLAELASAGFAPVAYWSGTAPDAATGYACAVAQLS